MSAVTHEIRVYVANIRSFKTRDWVHYLCWMGTIFSLLAGTSAFVLFGACRGVVWPGYVYFVPIGTLLLCAALAVDDIGHRTLYKDDLRAGEGHVHRMIVATAVPSVMALCLCYEHPTTFRMPALALIFLSFSYSALDEAMHWIRYRQRGLDVVEMWSHFIAIFGHVLMISCWWQWYDAGYPGVAETLKLLPF